MESEVKIGNQVLPIKVNTFTVIDYLDTFNSEIFTDLQSIKDNVNEFSIGNILKIICRMLYVANKPFRKDYIGFNDFVSQFKMADLIKPEVITKITNALTEDLPKDPSKSE